MADKEKILRYFRSSGDEEIAAHLIDLAESVRKSGRYKLSGFLDPHERNVAEVVAANFEGIKAEFDGGFTNPERARCAFVSERFMGRADFEIACFEAAWDKRYYSASHRDVLGAIMGTGCTRDVLGDIVMVDKGAQFVMDKSFSGYILSNLTSVGSAIVSVSEIDAADLMSREEKVKEITATVAALRLDAVAAAGFGTSRSRMSDEIKSQNVKINWKEAKNASQSVAEGDVISFRGRGRVELCEVRGTTKKGRYSILLKRYI